MDRDGEQQAEHGRVEPALRLISKHCGTTRNYEHLPASHEAMILWPMIALMTRRLTQTTEYQTRTKPAISQHVPLS